MESERRETAEAANTELTNRTDRTLIDLVQSGREEAAAVLYARYAARLRALASSQLSRNLASKLEPDDIVQSVFKSFFRRAAHGLYDVPRHEELWGLLLVSALNKIRAKGNFHGAAKRDVRKTVSVDLVGEDVERDDDPIALADLRMAIDDVLGRLPSGYRDVIERRIAGAEVAEIAETVGRSKRTVERILQEFRQMLLTQIQGEETPLSPPSDA
jgi:RNA polymerase sigma-70 factor, ECF subfamily